MAIEKELLDRLLADRDPEEVFAKDGLLDDHRQQAEYAMLLPGVQPRLHARGLEAHPILEFRAMGIRPDIEDKAGGNQPHHCHCEGNGARGVCRSAHRHGAGFLVVNAVMNAAAAGMHRTSRHGWQYHNG